MSFSDLATMPIDEFINKNQGSESTLWLFQHIPKTAGSSFSIELRDNNPPYQNICVNYFDTETPHHKKLEKQVESFINDMSAKPVRTASGHLPLALVDKIVRSHPDCRVVTFLRSPEARVISDYRYQRTPMHPSYIEFTKEFPTLESYIESDTSHNKMAKFLLPDEGNFSLGDVSEAIGKSHAFIGLLEMYPMSFNIMWQLMGRKGLWPREHARKTPQNDATRVEINAILKAKIRDTNKIDRAIFDYVHGVLVKQRALFWNMTKDNVSG